MEPMGKCPVCEHKVAPTCQTCPQCGNTDWWRKTGKHGERLACFCCPVCHAGDNQYSCSRCNGKGHVTEKREWSEWVDTRGGEKYLVPRDKSRFDLSTYSFPVIEWL